MKKLAKLFYLPVLIALFSSSVLALELPSDWSKTYTTDMWQGQCEVKGRGGCREGYTYYYDAGAGILANFFSASGPPVARLIIASSKGKCVGGHVAIEGEYSLELVGNGNYCTVAGGKIFRDANRITNSYSQLDIGAFRRAKKIVVDVQLAEGGKLTAIIPMNSFGEKLDAARGL